MIPYRTEIFKFLQSYLRNRWIQHPRISVYVRKGQRKLPNQEQYQQTFDVANIQVHPDHQGKGIFTEWLDIVESEARLMEFDAVFVESILNKVLIPFLERRGYQHIPGSEPPSMYLPL